MPKVVILFTDPSPLWYESIRHTFILAHHVTPLKGGWVHSITLGHLRRAIQKEPPKRNRHGERLQVSCHCTFAYRRPLFYIAMNGRDKAVWVLRVQSLGAVLGVEKRC